ncbi:ferredoxin reductase family protein [Pengzhenrongella sicca]|uniref:Ferric reductase-like transmembrane domain-containing protein n=1 Tax=Pengzhenrongella sicca TaxID=2819238 RepID=A0A8A4ZGB4_9MICO|nr:ferredoxin reductase family protein [Pengzhenrongella sicca]QTE29566.1 ferric reductase-like transmembrane domain-containing protein [Pengzhenrongella sicca]
MSAAVISNQPSLAAAPRPLHGPVRRTWWSGAVGLAVWACLLFVVALWVSNSGVQALGQGLGSALTSTGRLTGLVSSALLLVQVIAMARVPWIERALGQDRLAHWHRLVGFTSFNLMLAHILLITLGYASLAQTGALGELWSLVTTAPGMLLAAAGTVCLVMIVVTSIRAARRRLRYESWHLLHLYAYLGAGLALPHQLWTGTDFLFSPWATAFWWALYAAALASVLVYRVAVPLAASRRQRLVVSRVVPEGPGVVTVYLTGRRVATLRVSAGQFFVWRFKTGTGWTRGHPLSLSAAPTSAGLRVTIGTHGDDGARLASITVGTPVLIEGPYGRLTADTRVRPRLVVFAAGLGIAPLLALLQEAAGDRLPATLVYRARSADELALRADVEQLAATSGLRVIELLGSRSRIGASWLPAQFGHVPGPEAVRRLIPDLPDHDVFVCGPAPWARAVVADLRAAGVAPEAIHLELFALE